MIPILYQDNRILVCLKPYGVLSTDEPGGLPGLLREQLGDAKACMRTVHRLDQTVGGVMVLARSKEAARRLSADVQGRSFRKEYLAVVHGTLPEKEGTWTDLLLRNKKDRRTEVVQEPGKDVQEAILDYFVVEEAEGLSLVRIRLRTGRTHQIRAQFSHHAHPLVGDRKYGAPEAEGLEGIALWSALLEFKHPQNEEIVHFEAPPPDYWPWTAFEH